MQSRDIEHIPSKAVTFEDEHWVYFGMGVGWEPDRCSKCLRLVKQYRAPNRYCINCWKLEIFFSNCTDVQGVKEYLLRESVKDSTLHGKWLKKKVKIPRELLTSVPEEAHPEDDVEEDGVILIYTKSIKERDERMRKLLKELRDKGLYKKWSISYRRGCVDYDLIIGNWKTWYNLNEDYPA